MAVDTYSYSNLPSSPVTNLDASNGNALPPPAPEPAKNEAKNLKQKIDDTFDQALLHIDKWPNADLTVVTGYLMYSAQALEKPERI